MHHSHKKARKEPANSNTECVLCHIPVLAPGLSHGLGFRDVSDDEEQEEVKFHYEKKGTYCFAPSIAEAEAAFKDIMKILKPPCKNGPGSIHHGLDDFTHSCVEAMRKFLWKYMAGNSKVHWRAASWKTANDHGRGPHHACLLQEWTQIHRGQERLANKYLWCLEYFNA